MIEHNINIGISNEHRKSIAEGLSKVLADSYTLYLMTHNFHWNVTGPMFSTLHQMFMTQYTEQWNALDEIAERIRALGFPAATARTARSLLPELKKAIDEPTTDLITQRLDVHEKTAWMLRSILE
jgi:starvation-inducible DNA-binding protein